jgi:hypothetical protein
MIKTIAISLILLFCPKKSWNQSRFIVTSVDFQNDSLDLFSQALNLVDSLWIDEEPYVGLIYDIAENPKIFLSTKDSAYLFFPVSKILVRSVYKKVNLYTRIEKINLSNYGETNLSNINKDSYSIYIIQRVNEFNYVQIDYGYIRLLGEDLHELSIFHKFNANPERYIYK